MSLRLTSTEVEMAVRMDAAIRAMNDLTVLISGYPNLLSAGARKAIYDADYLLNSAQDTFVNVEDDELPVRPIHVLASLPKGEDCTEAESAAIKRYMTKAADAALACDDPGAAFMRLLIARWPSEWWEVGKEQ